LNKMISSFRRLSPRILANFKLQKRLFSLNASFMKEKNDKESVDVHSLVTSNLSMMALPILDVVNKMATFVEKLEEKNKEMLNMKQEMLKMSEEKNQEMLNMTKEKNQEMLNMKQEMLNILRRVCNVRAALEYVRGCISSKTGQDFLFHEPVDKVLEKLSKDELFTECLEATCEKNQVNVEAVKKCIGGLYHTASKGLHGHDKVVILETDWVVNEIIALGLIFKYYGVPFEYRNANDQLVEFPYELKSR
ncbi:13968_t:CDS:2, partial [Gigaspora rosea]